MKKLISLILTLALCLTAVSAFAETKTDFTAEQISISIPENAEGLGKVELNGNAKALTYISIGALIVAIAAAVIISRSNKKRHSHRKGGRR